MDGRVRALAERTTELERLAGLGDKLIEKQHGMLAEQDGRIDALNRLVSGHVSATHDKESVATHMHFSAHEYRFEKLAQRVTELEGKLAEYLIHEDGEIHPVEFVILDEQP